MKSIFSCVTLGVLYWSRAALAAPTPLEARSVSAAIFNNLNLFVQYCAAAYCPNQYDGPTNAITCSSGNCPLVQSAGASTVYEFSNSLLTDVTGFVAVDPTHHLVVVSFRGSESIRNYIADADFPVTSTDICSGCTADQGFWTSWEEARSGVIAAVESAAASHPGYSLVVTGHSLGGAIAALAAADIRNRGYTVALYTYGQPRIGGPTISTYITDQPGGNYRVTHYDDPIPRLPPILFGFVHISPEYHITTGNNVPVTANDINIYYGEINFSGNTGTTGFDEPAHDWYFEDVTACNPGVLSFK